ncbi:hypothetical protein SNEBB_006413 [Seison nebaliae]|nr:hypothetical protein SNEBB_006413 [Seison nebaliae]
MKFFPISLLVLLPVLSQGLYFHIKEGEKKCFIEEIPDDTMVIAAYKVEVYDPNTMQYIISTNNMGMHVEVKDPQQKIFLSKTYSNEGRVVFTSQEPGEHVLCMASNASNWFGGNQLRIHLKIDVGEHTNDYEKISRREKLTELQLRIRQLLDQVDQISKEQKYQRYREERFRQTSDTTNSRVLYWFLGQLGILVVTGYWQAKHLQSFFEAKKIV